MTNHPYTQNQREEHNLIARAIVLQEVVVDPRPQHLLEPGQLAADALAADMEQAWRSSMALGNQLADLVLAGAGDAATRVAREHKQVRRTLGRLMRAYGSRRTESTGARAKSSTHRITIEGMPFYFELNLIWVADRIEVANRLELELETGLVPPARAWLDLAAWVGAYDRNRRLRTASTEELVWHSNQNEANTLRLRQNIATQYPDLPTALEVVRVSLSVNEAIPHIDTPRNAVMV